MTTLEERIAEAVRCFWAVRARQFSTGGSGTSDQGNRAAVTGGAHCDGFIDLVQDLLVESGTPRECIYRRRGQVNLPGWFRSAKDWDLLVIFKKRLLASVEFKSQVGSFGNNFNNRTEEALGNALDLQAAYREGAFKPSPQPWLGWFMLLEDAPGSKSAVGVSEPHFKVFPEFRGASYAKRYEIFAQKLVRERLYTAACLLLSDRTGGALGDFQEPLEELTFRTFAASLIGHVSAVITLEDA